MIYVCLVLHVCKAFKGFPEERGQPFDIIFVEVNANIEGKIYRMSAAETMYPAPGIRIV